MNTTIEKNRAVYKNFKTGDVEDVGHNALIFTVSTNEIDREGDVIDINGLSADSYMRNPVFLYGHDYSSLPIGRTTRLAKQQEGDVQKLKARVEFTPDSAYGPNYAGITGQAVRRMYLKNFLSATSIGFAPWETKPLVDKRISNPGNVYLTSDLLDISAVTVPANAGALMERAAHDPELKTMFKSWAKDAVVRCENCAAADDDDIYRVDMDDLNDVLDEIEGIETTYLVDEDDFVAALDDVLNTRRR